MNTLENKTVLVTGAGGFIGSHLVRRLAGVTGIRLLLLSRKQQLVNRDAGRWLVCSLGELSREYWALVDIPRIHAVFHLGGFTPKNTSQANDVESIFSDNLLGTRKLLESLPEGTETFIFSSTLDVYAPPSPAETLNERSRTEPAGLYGASKLFCERLVSNWSEERGCSHAILRYGHIFGPGEEAYSKLIPLVIRQLLAGQQPTVYGRGDAERDFLYVSDAVEATLRAASSSVNVGPVNIVRGESVSIREIVEHLISHARAGVRINYLVDKPAPRVSMM